MLSAVFATQIVIFALLLRAISKAKKTAPLLFFVPLLLAASAATGHGQSALDGFDPNANSTVRVVVVQPDGKTLLGGAFTTISPNGGPAVARNHIARLNPDGTLDTAFNPNANDVIYTIALQADGKILVGGIFTVVGGQPRNRIARLDPVTGLADSFDSNANSEIYSIAVQSNGKVLAGGLFTNIGGAARNYIARLDPGTGLADSFNPSASNSVVSIVLQTDGKILAGGAFSGANSIGGATRNHIARLDPTTGLADSFDPNANSVVWALAVQADGKVLAGGIFNGANSIGGQSRNHIARLDPKTGLADSFDPNANMTFVRFIAVAADGKILVGGDFTSIGQQARNYIARLDATTGEADSFNPKANGGVDSIVVRADGKILAGGWFTTFAPNGGATATRNHIALLEIDGTLDKTLNNVGFNALDDQVYSIAVQPDGKTLIGGVFHTVMGISRNGIARLNVDGTLDTAFDPNADAWINSIAVQADGKILVGGEFSIIGGQSRPGIARLEGSTGSADAFDPRATGEVYSISVQADGKILVGGLFTSIGGQPRNRIGRLDAASGLADSFNPNATDAVRALTVQEDGKILVGGLFSGPNSIGGKSRNYIARLDPVTGLADDLFNPNADNWVNSLAVQADGKILVGGSFTNIGEQTREGLARLDSTTGLADSFHPNANGSVGSIVPLADNKILVGGFFTGIGGQTRVGIARLERSTGLADSFDSHANDFVFSVAVQHDGKILAGGFFTRIGGQTLNGFARLSNDTAALQNIAVTQSTITWTRSGSISDLTRVSFESSADNVNYTPLGNATASGSDWTLTGLNLATGQNLYIRARGYYRGGFFSSSTSLTESVRYAFIAAPTATPTPLPTASPAPAVGISGTISYCSNPVPGPVPNVIFTLTGSGSGSTLSDSSGSYQFSSLASGGNYTVTPTKSRLLPASSGINTVDVVAVQRHFLSITPIPAGCRSTAADVDGNANINTVDVIAIQRFYLGIATGTANVGKYQFTPANRTYLGISSDQSGQYYDTLIFGDVVASFADRADGSIKW